jgi:hypothetical protein
MTTFRVNEEIMKKFLMAIVLCLVCTLSFGQESKYVKTTSLNFVETGEDFIIARKLNGKNIAVFNCDTVPSQGIFLKMDNDSTVFCNDSVSMCCLGLSIMRNKDGKYLSFKQSNFFSDEYNAIYIKVKDSLFSIYSGGISSGRMLSYSKNDNNFYIATYQLYNAAFPSGDLEIYVKQSEDSTNTNINNITIKQNTIKCIKNGKLIIQKDGKTYDILGNETKQYEKIYL